MEELPQYDFSKAETRALFVSEVRKHQELLGCTLEQAQMLVAALMAPAKITEK